MRFKIVHIIACFLFSLFVSKEVLADMHFNQSAKKELCQDCESQDAGKNAEERTSEQEQKLLVEAMFMPLPVSSAVFDQAIFKEPYLSTIAIGILTPPPEKARLS